MDVPRGAAVEFEQNLICSEAVQTGLFLVSELTEKYFHILCYPGVQNSKRQENCQRMKTTRADTTALDCTEQGKDRSMAYSKRMFPHRESNPGLKSESLGCYRYTIRDRCFAR
ncbi:hypothetical protein PROFUN_15149 [Planoprotostelium fungivorum]|uniref:Uncharacterized protein n=1 Tax=Planoprotostelium fungivorum TaxID=1890364 RepID=A0A2P6MXR1_9EUKA|nr:hypothetical protein PROFUN_15149 [Planoprotostelium fungivorum]